MMSDNAFLSALQKIASGGLSLGDLINVSGNLTASGQLDAARQLYKVWINCNRDNPLLYVAHFNCSSLDSQAGDVHAATESLKQAIAINPDFLPAYINLGGFIERAGNTDAALELWRTAAVKQVVMNGNAVQYATAALKQMARVLLDRQQLEQAEIAISQCLDINPAQSDVIEQFVALRLAQCKWPVLVPTERLDRNTQTKGIHPLSVAVYTDDPILQLASAERYARQLSTANGFYPESDRRHATIDLTGRRMRIGYVSSDLRDHAIGYLMAEFFERHDKTNVEVFAYYCGPESNTPLNARIRSAIEHWVDIRKLSDAEAAKRIAADGIDILIDVNGHTRDARAGVFARRPAPIIVNWLGYPGTMGTPYHHYIIADDWIIPEEAELYYSEKVLRLPCYQPNDRKREVAAKRPTRTEVGLPENAFVYCCFNGTHKINRGTFERWLTILKAVDGSVLWLLDTSAETKKRLQDYALKHGVEAQRLIFAPKIQNALHLARYPLADLFLDTLPYGAHTTASDALWMGVPVLTLSGRCFAARVCASLVRSAGTPELVTEAREEYTSTAINLGLRPEKAKALMERLQQSRDNCRLFNLDLLVDRLEDLYRQICADHSAGRAPKPDLRNLDHYLEAGIDHDHEAQEMGAIADYHSHYKAKLAKLHFARPIPPDNRLWRQADIDAAESALFECGLPEMPQSIIVKLKAGQR